MSAAETTRAARTVALACRVLAHHGLAEDVLGHVSVRTGPDSMLVRCRGPRERGLLFTTDDDVREVGLDADGPLDGGYRASNELPIHSEVLRARPDVGAVVHVHPPAVVAADLAGLPLRPIIGAYKIPALRLAREGIAVYPRGVLIRRRELGVELVEAMGDKPGCIRRGHLRCGSHPAAGDGSSLLALPAVHPRRVTFRLRTPSGE